MELQVLLAMPVLESGSPGLPAVPEGGGVMDEMGLPFSSFTSGDRGLQPPGATAEAKDGCTTECSCKATKATAGVSLE